MLRLATALGYNPAVPLLTPLDADERATFLVVALPPKVLRKLVGQLGTAPSGTRLDTLAVWDLAWSLVDYYEKDHEVVAAVDKALRRELGDAPLSRAVAADGGAQAVTDLLLRARDPARDLAWALLRAGGGDTGKLAAECVGTIIAEFDEADARAREDEKQQPEGGEEPEPAGADPSEARRAVEKEAARARSERDRVVKRMGGLKGRLVELEKSLATARRELRAADDARTRLESERKRLAEEREALRAQLQSGTAAEVVRLGEELDASARRVRALEADLEEARESEAQLSVRLRRLAEERAARPAAPGELDERPAPGSAGWSLPIFTGEFYESIRRWDRKIVRNAFEKIYRLAEDWRHPSLRAIPLEGLPDCFRIRVATDVRLIYRPLDGNRVEILSLIDREDLQRYIRQAKTR